MKKNILIVSALLVASGLLLMNSCKKDDTTPPVVSVTGSTSMTAHLNGTYSDAGATATDDVDGSITPTSNVSSTNPNMNLAGTYTITYSATDKAGNTGTATRTVIVQNDAAYLAGTYTTAEVSGPTWTQTITASTTVNNRIIFSYFGDYANNNQIYAQVTGTSVDITSQTAVGIGAGGCTHTFAPNGSGTGIVLTAGKYAFSVKYTDTELGGGTCTVTGAVPVEDGFLQQ